MVCYAMLCYATLRYAMLRYAMLCYAMLRPPHPHFQSAASAASGNGKCCHSFVFVWLFYNMRSLVLHFATFSALVLHCVIFRKNWSTYFSRMGSIRKMMSSYYRQISSRDMTIHFFFFFVKIKLYFGKTKHLIIFLITINLTGTSGQ